MKLIMRLFVCLTVSAAALSQTDDHQPVPYASEGGKAQIIPSRPVTESEDTLNTLSKEATTDGLAVVITIDGTNVTLDSVAFARVPRALARANRKVEGDSVLATAFSGGKRVASTVVPDQTVNASEDGGIVRLTRRQVALVLAADVPIERVEIEASATNARGSLDVRSAYAEICKADPQNKWCPGPAAR